jgi:hypothetical protein
MPRRPKIPNVMAKVHKERKALLLKGKGNPEELREQIRGYFWNVATHMCLDPKNLNWKVTCSCVMSSRGWLEDDAIH